MDVKWIVDEQMNAVANGGCKLASIFTDKYER